MAISEMPNIPPQNVPVIIAQANQAQANDVTTMRTLGVCAPVPNHYYSLENVVEPIDAARTYFRLFEPQQMADGPATITILQQPKHGILRPVIQADVGTILESGGDPVDPSAGLYFYLPENGYLGKDSATVLVEIGGIQVKVKYYFQAISGGLGNYASQTYCGKTGDYWKISTTLDPNGTSTLTSVEYQSPTISSAGTFVTAAKLDLLGTAKNSFFGMKR